VEEGDGVLLLAHNHPQTLLAWLALLQCGARILPVNPQLPRPLLDVLLPQMTLRFALVLDGTYDGLPALSMRERPGMRCVAAGAAGVHDADLRLHRAAESGGAYLRAHLASARGVLSLMPYGEDDDWLLSLPLFHVSGQGILWRWLQAGARLTVREKQPLEQALRAVPTLRWCRPSSGVCLMPTSLLH
jgi:O-succinylbenzoic acid--CoA ligase